MTRVNLRTCETTIILRAYFWFAIAVTIFQFCRLATGPALSFTVPYTGWMIAFPYLGSLLVPPLFLIRGEKSFLRLQSVRDWLVCGAIIGVFDFACGLYIGNDENSYLRVSLWRPVFTVLVPCLWILLLNRSMVASHSDSGEGPAKTSGA